MSAILQLKVVAKVSTLSAAFCRRFGKFSISNYKYPDYPFDLSKLMGMADAKKSNILGDSGAVVSLHCLGSGAKGFGASLYVYTPSNRYLFNCGEGIQRTIADAKYKTGRLNNTFITYPQWDRIGGLLGMSLTLQSYDCKRHTIHGTRLMEEMFNSTKRFVKLNVMETLVNDVESSNSFEDGCLHVDFVRLYCYPSEVTDSVTKLLIKHSGAVSDDNSDTKSATTSCNSDLDLLNQLTKKAAVKRADKVLGSICYICRVKKRPPVLDIDACIKLEIPVGPLLGQLKKGEDIVLEDGRRINSKDVTFEDKLPPIFLVVDVPHTSFLRDFCSKKEFIKHQASGLETDQPDVIVHFTPPEIMKDPMYQKWMNDFSPKVHHFIINEDSTCLGLESVYDLQYKLNLLHPEIFPMLDHTHAVVSDKDLTLEGLKERLPLDPTLECLKEMRTPVFEEDFKNSKYKPSDERVVQGKARTKFQLRPVKGFYRQAEISLTPKLYIAEALIQDNAEESLKELRKELEAAEKATPNKRMYPQVVFLGTGSSLPGKTRNSSGILIHLDSDTCILLDCGEGTYSQLLRHYGPEKTKEVLKKLKAVFISHMHADHHMGLVGLLRARAQTFNVHFKAQLFENYAAGVPIAENTRALYVMAPSFLFDWLDTYNKHFEQIAGFYKAFSHNAMECREMQSEEVQRDILAMQDSLNLSQLEVVLVPHCKASYAVSFKQRNGFKISYSGDCTPSQPFIKLGQGSDLLIHEATFGDNFKDEATAKKHTVISDAIDVGRQMNAKFTILTHFSQRYSKLPFVCNDLPDNVGLAFDNMQVTPDQFHLLPKMMKTLKLFFSEAWAEAESRANRKAYKMMRFERLRNQGRSNASEPPSKRQALL